MFARRRTGSHSANKDLAVISNNISNAGTNGFKRSEAQFEDLYRTIHNNTTEKAVLQKAFALDKTDTKDMLQNTAAKLKKNEERKKVRYKFLKHLKYVFFVFI